MPSTAIVKYDKSEVISHFSNLTQVLDVDGLTDAVLFTFMKDGLRVSVQVLRPFCVSFMERFKKAKKEKKDFHGFTDFNRAAERLTGYSGRQIRNLAAGTPTPLKKAAAKRLTEAVKITRDEARKLQDELDIAAARSTAARNRSNAESQAAQKETPSASPTIAVFPISQQELNELKDFKKIAAAKETARLSHVEETDALLDYILKSIKLGTGPSVAIGNKIYSLAEKIRFHRTKRSVA